MLGPPGAGKGTQAPRLARHFGIPHIATGDMFREAVESHSQLGATVRSIIESGQLVPDDVTNEVMRVRLDRGDADAGFILDGYPRSPEQAEVLDRYLTRKERHIDAVIRLSVPEREIVARISGRRVCPKCNTVYHILTSPPKVPGVCDRDGCSLVQREDDREGTVRARLDVYGIRTKPLMDLYAERGLLLDVDAMGTEDEVFGRLLEALGRPVG